MGPRAFRVTRPLTARPIDYLFPRVNLPEVFSAGGSSPEAADRLSPTTVEKYRRTWRLDIDHVFGATPLAAITRADVRDAVREAETRASAWQAAEALKLIRRLLNGAVDAEHIARNVAARIPLPEGQRTPVTILKPEQLHRAADNLPERNRVMALLGVLLAAVVGVGGPQA